MSETPETPIKTLGKYQIRGELGKGAMGVVYLGFDPALPPQSRGFHAPKWSPQVAQQPAVDPNDAKIEGCRHPVAAIQVTAPDRCCQPILGAIGVFQCLGFSVKGCQRDYRAKNFLLSGAAIQSQVNLSGASP